MFGGSMFNTFDNDPFFESHRQHMARMNQMMQNPFAPITMMQPPMAIEGSQRQQVQQVQRPRHRGGQEMALAGDPMFGGDIFSHMNQMMSNMNQMMSGMHTRMQNVQTDPNAQFYSQSTVMSYSNDGRGQPRVYQATTSTKQAPGGVRETKRSVRDSEAGIQKMAVGRHIGERGHVVTKQKNIRTGELEENHDYNNLDEEEAETFHQEFMNRAGASSSGGRRHHQHDRRSVGGGPERARHRTPAIRDRHH